MLQLFISALETLQFRPYALHIVYIHFLTLTLT